MTNTEVKTQAVERVIDALRGRCTQILVTHEIEQAARVADRTAYLDRGALVEAGPTVQLFTAPRHPSTEAYLSRRAR